MRPVACLARVLLLGIVLAMCLPTSASLGRGARMTVLWLTPPPGVAVPVGQALEVRCRVLGDATRLALWSDGTLIFTTPVVPGQEVTHSWAPIEPGVHCLAALAFNERGESFAQSARLVVGLPPHSSARLALAAEGIAIEAVSPDDLRCISRGGVP